MAKRVTEAQTSRLPLAHAPNDVLHPRGNSRRMQSYPPAKQVLTAIPQYTPATDEMVKRYCK